MMKGALSTRELCSYLGLSRSEVYRRRFGDPAAGIQPDPSFPKPREAGPRKLVWLLQDANEFLAGLPLADGTDAERDRRALGKKAGEASAKVRKGAGSGSRK